MATFDPTRSVVLTLAAISALALAACEDRNQAPELSQAQDVAASPQAAAPAVEAPVLASSALDAMDARLAQLVANEDRSGVVMLMARHGEVQHVSQAGYANVSDGTPMTADTLVRIASMTKPVTAAAIMLLVEDGVISLNDPVADYIPAFANARVATSLQVNEEYEIPTEPLDRPITIEDLLTHTSGIGYIFDYQTNLGALYIGNDIYQGGPEVSMDQRMETLAGLPLYFQPGERWYYSYANDVLGHVVAAASGQSLENFKQARIFGPLGMTSTSYFPDERLRERLSTLYTHDDLGDMVPVEGSADQAALAPFEAGGAGLFSTANDYFRFAQMLANGGELDGVRVLSEASVAAMTAPHIQADRMPEGMASVDMAFGYSLSVIHDGPGQHPFRRNGDFGWGGYFDTNFVVSPSTGMVAIIMAQELPGASTGDTIAARDVFDALAYAAIPVES
ncbi:beta-lactamase family protein [Maricaulaceae bacterium EIL42A08]|nr:beta-lactamase family protein [Maricaulaceae bacterium EIL42A08]